MTVRHNESLLYVENNFPKKCLDVALLPLATTPITYTPTNMYLM